MPNVGGPYSRCNGPKGVIVEWFSSNPGAVISNFKMMFKKHNTISILQHHQNTVKSVT